jgi:hypothetical protein
MGFTEKMVLQVKEEQKERLVKWVKLEQLEM